MNSSRLAGIGSLLTVGLLLGGCAVVPAEPGYDDYGYYDYDRSYGYGPSRGYAVSPYGYRYVDGLTLRYDPQLAVYLVVGSPGLYWWDNHYYRHHAGHWEHSRRHLGPWNHVRNRPLPGHLHRDRDRDRHRIAPSSHERRWGGDRDSDRRWGDDRDSDRRWGRDGDRQRDGRWDRRRLGDSDRRGESEGDQRRWAPLRQQATERPAVRTPRQVAPAEDGSLSEWLRRQRQFTQPQRREQRSTVPSQERTRSVAPRAREERGAPRLRQQDATVRPATAERRAVPAPRPQAQPGARSGGASRTEPRLPWNRERGTGRTERGRSQDAQERGGNGGSDRGLGRWPFGLNRER